MHFAKPPCNSALPFVGFALPLRRRGRLADERREFTLSVIGLLVTL
jgi:hypothetical protein